MKSEENDRRPGAEFEARLCRQPLKEIPVNWLRGSAGCGTSGGSTSS